MLLSFLFVCCVVVAGSNTAVPGTNSEQRDPATNELEVARYFDDVMANEAALIALLQGMPKGGDLHNHPSGTIDAELVLQTAIDKDLFFDREKKTFVEKPPDGDPAGYYTAEQMQLSGDGSTMLRSEILNAISMRESRLNIDRRESGHDHFFSFWKRVGAAYPSQEDIYRSLFRRAVADRVGYLELMDNVSADDVRKIDGILAEVLSEFNAAGLPWKLTVNFITAVSRNQPLDEFKRSLEEAVSAQYDDGRRVVATTILSPEDSYISQRDFGAQMDAIDILYTQYALKHADAPPKMTLHTGELTLDYATYESMFDRISASLGKGHAARIDHGSSIAWDLNTYDILKKMRDEDIGVTICPTSNSDILNLAGNRHPFALYRAAGVKIALATDDMGIERTNFTGEFVRAAQTFDLKYADLKGLAYGSIDMAMISDGEKSALRISLDAGFDAYEARIAKVIKEFAW
jgi:adenosine deaminase